ncbi:Crp/Fnr family transcriptional regulator [Streptomyces sp. NPDC005438]|uniref:Crp/Fnr family transcriptional regulator n=1 Tax=Streptomyces sp. NPDC005438 TaxID=3156880 RepID=UPI0033AFC9E9
MYQPHAQALGDELWSQLKELAPLRTRPARSILLREGDSGTHVILLAWGSAVITRTARNGERMLLAVRGAGELLGELAVLDSQPRTASVLAAEKCGVHVIPAVDFLKFVESHDLLSLLLQHAIARVREGDAVRVELATSPVPVRLASALERLCKAATMSASFVTVRLTQTELSQLIGASRNAVGAALKPWRERGWIETTSGGGLSIRNISAIQSHAGMTL